MTSRVDRWPIAGIAAAGLVALATVVGLPDPAHASPVLAHVTLSNTAAGLDGVTATVSVTVPTDDRAPVASVTVQLPGAGEQPVLTSVSGTGPGKVAALPGGGFEFTSFQPRSWAGTTVQLDVGGLANPDSSSVVATVALRGPTGTEIGEAVQPLALGAAGPCGGYRRAGWLARENSRPGLSWSVPTGQTTVIEGYADVVSATCGQSVSVAVATSAASYQIQVFRVGYYGGLNGRLLWTSPVEPALVQPPPTLGVGNMVEAQWRPQVSFTIPGDWPPGDYLLRLVPDVGAPRLVPLTVRDDGSPAALYVQNAVLTWQAYNDWDGYSLYRGAVGATDYDRYLDRSRVVSFNRPYASDGVSTFGDGRFVSDEAAFVEWAEQRGLDVTYGTDVDVAAHGSLLLRHRAVVELGHSEYWTPGMRAALQTAIGHGVNVALLGANTMYWAARLAPDLNGLPSRHEVVYRVASDDPMFTVNPPLTTVRYRDYPLSAPEQRVTGGMYTCMFKGYTSEPAVVTDPAAWVYSGTGVAAADQLPGVVGGENDRFFPGQGPPVQILAHNAFPCAAYNNVATSWDMTYYTASSGAGVLDTGSIWWVCAMTGSCPSQAPNAAVMRVLGTITANVLGAFAKAPAGLAHPAAPNSWSVYPTAAPAILLSGPPADSDDEEAAPAPAMPVWGPSWRPADWMSFGP